MDVGSIPFEVGNLVVCSVKFKIQTEILFQTDYLSHTDANFYDALIFLSGRPGSSAGIATGYGLDGPGIEYRVGRDFPHLPKPALGSTQPPLQWVPGLSQG